MFPNAIRVFASTPVEVVMRFFNYTERNKDQSASTTIEPQSTQDVSLGAEEVLIGAAQATSLPTEQTPLSLREITKVSSFLTTPENDWDIFWIMNFAEKNLSVTLAQLQDLHTPRGPFDMCWRALERARTNTVVPLLADLATIIQYSLGGALGTSCYREFFDGPPAKNVPLKHTKTVIEGLRRTQQKMRDMCFEYQRLKNQ